jgi:hypothetical protein
MVSFGVIKRSDLIWQLNACLFFLQVSLLILGSSSRAVPQYSWISPKLRRSITFSGDKRRFVTYGSILHKRVFHETFAFCVSL